MSKSNYDLVIIGAGPAGLTAGMYAARARMNVLLLEKAVPGGQILVTDWIENYPGFPEGISGFDLSEKMRIQAEEMGLKIEIAEVHSLNLSKELKEIVLKDRSIITKSLIIASGASPKNLGIGEDKFIGKGVSFCATCDAPFFKGKTVVAIGGGDTAVQEAIFLTKFAKKVYLIHRRDELRAAKILQERAFENNKIEIVWDSVATSIEGFFGVESVKIKNIKTNEEKVLKADGCFIWVGILPNTSFLNDAVETDEFGFILADTKMQTSVPGVYAVGDVRDTPLRQITTAVGDAAIAALSAEHFIENL
ncbi:MAG: thioredoxin-disulfide reductase [Desulfobacula sp.]|jgi:thioredoxin reductase (NADPH)|uniref:thioredoxin-disulfide reductase n=1 Tax=Desulfobacula sp. TaxID=2593537 RepID=UPI001DEDE709|nr:thioredoxin-disulfide reductase [Desulfobacula sp.]MBT3483958.1 thioredoxin-disulfide reductase [Desulfobacula sp.]MBT3803855.1 thioredoxin-disulfide reductase [Desulfobacula sp.]MBT4023800.1 thioredoxin-disulfide reductase [Desulfobacula sp.]MBT4197640.1 thioredoxin-disulfide reductase [Desulfobacula sp.]